MITPYVRPEVRVGRVLSVDVNEGARHPAYVLAVDLGPTIGVKISSAQLTHLYSPESLVGTLVIAVTNLPPKRVNGIKSEILVLAAVTDGVAVLITPERPVPEGTLIA